MTKLKRLSYGTHLNPVLNNISEWVNTHADEDHEPSITNYPDYDKLEVKPAHYFLIFDDLSWRWEIMFFDTYETIEELPF